MNSLSPKILILIGFIIMVVGLTWMYGGKYFQWLGKLPGDIRIEKEHFRFYFPIATMVLVSLFFSLIMKILKWMGLLQLYQHNSQLSKHYKSLSFLIQKLSN